jgi:uncharacterized zinc-type alcohol dehydrogenase-like protein
MPTAKAYGATSQTAPLGPLQIERRAPTAEDVEIKILYCGICHSDIHTARGEWAGTSYPVVPGHEVVGRVSAIGAAVKRFKIGDLVGVGCMVDSCRSCSSCKESLEQYCERSETVFTYNSADKHLPGQRTYGGYSTSIVVAEPFVLKISEKLDLAAAAPLLCAGITTYSPLKHWGAGPGKKVGIVGLGGLGSMGVKFSHAFGAHTVLFTTSPSKIVDGKKIGADEVVLSKDPAQMERHQGSFDFILNTVAASHNLDAYTSLLKRDGTLCLVGAPEHPHPSPSVMGLIFKRRAIAGSLIGGIKETQAMLDFCAERGIVTDIELIQPSQINEAYERVIKSDVKYRFVIDCSRF